MKQNKILVIGGSGFIGTHLAKCLDFTNIDLKDGNDFRDPTRVALCEYDVIILLAAEHIEPSKYAYRYNLSIYQALSNCRGHVIFASSAAVYGESDEPHTEDEEPEPSTIYGKSKLLGEQIVQDLFDSWTILRFANVYGDGDGHGAIDIFKRGGKTIYGSGSQVRDYIYVDDVAKSIAKVAEKYAHHSHQIYNISSGRGDTVSDMFHKHGTGIPDHHSARNHDVSYSVLSNRLAKVMKVLS